MARELKKPNVHFLASYRTTSINPMTSNSQKVNYHSSYLKAVNKECWSTNSPTPHQICIHVGPLNYKFLYRTTSINPMTLLSTWYNYSLLVAPVSVPFLLSPWVPDPKQLDFFSLNFDPFGTSHRVGVAFDQTWGHLCLHIVSWLRPAACNANTQLEVYTATVQRKLFIGYFFFCLLKILLKFLWVNFLLIAALFWN